MKQICNDEVVTRVDTRLRGMTTLKMSLRVPGVPAEIRKDILSNKILEHSVLHQPAWLLPATLELDYVFF